MLSPAQRRCNIDSEGTLTLRNISVAVALSSCPSGSMLDLAEATTIHCPLGLFVGIDRVCDVSESNVSDGARYYKGGVSECVPCGDTAATSLATLAGITVAVLLLICWCGLRQPCKRLRVAHHS